MGALLGADTPMKDSELGTHNRCLMHPFFFFFFFFFTISITDRIILSLSRLRVDIRAPLLKKHLLTVPLHGVWQLV